LPNLRRVVSKLTNLLVLPIFQTKIVVMLTGLQGKYADQVNYDGKYFSRDEWIDRLPSVAQHFFPLAQPGFLIGSGNGIQVFWRR
jgi:hypothetical protein